MNILERLANYIMCGKDLGGLESKIEIKDVEIKLLRERIDELETTLNSGKTQSNNKRISKDKEIEIVKRYMKGNTISSIGRELEISRNTIYKALRRNNIEV